MRLSAARPPSRPAASVPGIAAESGSSGRAGAWYSYGEQRIGQGRENAKMYLKDNPVLLAEVEEKVKTVLGIRPAVAESEADAAEE